MMRPPPRTHSAETGFREWDKPGAGQSLPPVARRRLQAKASVPERVTQIRVPDLHAEIEEQPPVCPTLQTAGSGFAAWEGSLSIESCWTGLGHAGTGVWRWAG